jgi:hypothetical protein
MEVNNMKQVVRYECKWCGKLFKTPNRHNCRFDPEHHNCLSCRHCGKFDRHEEEDWTVRAECVADGVFAQPTIVVKGFRCEYDGTEVGEGSLNDFPYAISVDGQGCPNWKQMEGYIGTRSFAERQRKLEQSDLK